MIKAPALALFLSFITCFGQNSSVRVASKNLAAALNRSQSIAIVRALLNKNARPCRIDRIGSIIATRSGAGWRVTARIVMSASGRPLNETVVWTVKANSREAVAASQLAAEVETGCG